MENARNPAWSPTESRIAFYSDRDGNDDIYVMFADGTDVKRLTACGIVDIGVSPAKL